MGFHATRQGAEHIATFQAGDDASLAKAPRYFFELLSHPDVVVFYQAHLAHIVFAVGIKASADENHLWLKGFEARQPHGLHQLAHLFALGVGGYGHVDHIAGRFLVAAVGVEGVLEEAAHQNMFVARQDVFCAVAVVYVKVNHSYALETSALHSVQGGNGDVVEKAKAHGLVFAGVVAGGAHGAKGVFQLAVDDGISGGQRRAHAVASSSKSMGVDGGVGIQLGIVGAARLQLFLQAAGQATQRGDIHAVMRQLNVVISGLGAVQAL